MTEPVFIETSSHVAVLDPIKGEGLLMCPPVERDVAMASEACLSLHEADWNAMMDRLLALGWTFVGGDYDEPLVVGEQSHGGEVVLLCEVAELTEAA